MTEEPLRESERIGENCAGCGFVADSADGAPSCHDCRAPYGEDGWCDVVIPNEVWNRISEGASILCFRCMTKRLEAHGMRDVPVLITSGPYRDANEEWRTIGWKHGHEVATAELLAEGRRLQQHALDLVADAKRDIEATARRCAEKLEAAATHLALPNAARELREAAAEIRREFNLDASAPAAEPDARAG